MIQIVAQRKGFIFTNPPRLVLNIASLFKYPANVLAGIDPKEHYNLYYTVAHHSGTANAEKPQRTASTFEYQNILPFDIDHADTYKAFEYAAIIAEVLQTQKENLIVVNSGNGVHVLAELRNPIQNAGYFKQNKPYYAEVCTKIARKLKDAGLPGEMDTSVFEPARVLRLPNTKNIKPSLPDKECVLLQYPAVQVALNIDLKELSGLGDLEKQNVSPQDVRRNYPKPDFAELVKECRFVDWALTKSDEVHEPHVFDLFSLLSAQNPAAKVQFQAQEMDSIQLAKWVHDNAVASKSLARTDFGEKWEQSSKYGVRKCSTINDRWGKCQECPHFGKISTPLALKSKEHISSEINGFWELGSKGKPLNPHYSDLSKVYDGEYRYVTTTEGRIFNFVETHYKPIQDLKVKSWLETKMVPIDPLREFHRNEFLSKIRVGSVLSHESQEELFERSIQGKLNCRNGVLDIVKGDLLQPEPGRGFTYVLPYDYVPGQVSEIFLDWLGTITQERTELMETLLDVMAYMLWPTYDDHVFTYFIGEGSNGKSTLMHVMQELVGRQNYSSVNIHQLVNNRFAPAALEGKLMNISEESSGDEISAEKLNILKNFSAGGEAFIERKGEQGYSFKNKAKLIFSANKSPRFSDKGAAIKRRLVVVPFDYSISVPNPNVEDQLISEVPKILSMLIPRIQVNLRENGGKFRMNRGGSTAAQAQKRMLAAGSNVLPWAKDAILSSLDLSEDYYIDIAEAYTKYVGWCLETGLRATDRLKFVVFLKEYVITPGAEEAVQRRVGSQRIRVFKHTRFKTENDL